MQITKDDLVDIITDASYRLHREIKQAYKDGTIEEYLEKVEMADLLPQQDPQPIYDTLADGKILIVGQTKLKPKDIYAICKNQGIDKTRLELHLNYEDVKSMDFRKYQYQANYRLMLFGPVPHSGVAKGDKSSIINELESSDGYPKIIRMTDANSMKITKSNLKRVIGEEIISGYLEID